MLRGWKFEIQLNEQSGKAIYLQIADAIIKDIHSGRLKPGDALPGSRNLSQLLKVNRNTVVEALNVLLIEGWLVAKERQGTFVADTLPDFKEVQKIKPLTSNIENKEGKHYHLQIDDGSPDSKIAPITNWQRHNGKSSNKKQGGR